MKKTTAQITLERIAATSIFTLTDTLIFGFMANPQGPVRTESQKVSVCGPHRTDIPPFMDASGRIELLQ
ncbi:MULTISPECIES: hypothetical protein [unclassified Beijerinckia]|uniref:hypothetical protein n=1 Tax=unclassified Beijerinckia TaxID=2638183 RepID=UPI0008945108|nr:MULTISPECIES: hypothetical protein [unclassified Beijerinckia]MDH7797484.1 hypothetical protein [Beijerinckia sp. GAS462]SEC87495.1 hypothetical protein SAMN05443249_3779 [Beijerinckia sp. 28-YEA-48]